MNTLTRLSKKSVAVHGLLNTTRLVRTNAASAGSGKDRTAVSPSATSRRSSSNPVEVEPRPDTPKATPKGRPWIIHAKLVYANITDTGHGTIAEEDVVAVGVGELERASADALADYEALIWIW